MKTTSKRFWIFEVMMLLCGVATTFIESLNYGISLFYLLGHMIVFPLFFFIAGIATWKVAKNGGVWQMAGYSLLFSVIVYNLFHLILFPVYGVPVSSPVYWKQAVYYVLFAFFPVILCCYVYKMIGKCLEHNDRNRKEAAT